MLKNNKILISIIFTIIFFLFITPCYAETNSPEISSSNYILMDYNTGKILSEKNIDEKIYPASTTKIMTAILVLENCKLNDSISVSNSAVDSVEFGYVTANLKPGETFTVEQMLYSLMVASANDAAFVLAEHVAGSTEKFAELMNQKALEIGCTNTHFINPNGIHNENHYTTVRDLSRITQYAMNNPTFRDIVLYKSYKLPTSELYITDDRIYSNTNELINPYSNFYYSYATGIKTGYTSAAGYCLVSSSTKNNLSLICIVLNEKTNEKKYEDTIALFNYGFDNYKVEQVVLKNTAVQTIHVKHATKKTKNLNALVEQNINILVRKDSNEIISPKIEIIDNLKAPIEEGSYIGTISYNIDGILYNGNLIASHSVKKSYLFLEILIFVIVCWFFILIFKKKKKKK